MRLKQLIENRKAKTNQIDALLKAAREAKRDLTDEEKTRFDTLRTDVEGIDAEIEREQQANSMNARQTELESNLQVVDQRTVENDPNSVGGNLSRQERRDLAGYSFLRAISANLYGTPLTGIEREMHEEALNDAQRGGTQVNGVGVPQLVLAASGASRFRDDLTAETATEGTETVATEVRSLIDHLHERIVVRQMGATFLSDLQGNIQFPRVTAGTDPAHKGENAAADETSPTFDTVTLSPERLPVYIEVSNQLLRQSSVDVENWVRQYLATRIAVIMDKMSINGSGASNQPEGILNVSGIGSVATDVAGKADKPTYEDIVDLETEVAVDNADMGTLGYLGTPKIRGTLKKTVEFSSAGSKAVWTGSRESGEMNGYVARASNVVPSNLTKGSHTGLSAIIFGNWEELLIGQWGGLDLLANPYSKDTEGIVRINAGMYYDVAVRHAPSFAAIVDANIVDVA